MPELQRSGHTDPGPWENCCEARWLQLFSLVEKQCREQIAAQQEQFHSQVQRIREEIRNSVKSQSSGAPWASCDGRSSNKQIPPERHMGFFSENSDRNDSVLSYPKSKEAEMQQDTPASQPDCSVDSSSVSSGYGTFCVSELNARRSKGPPEFMEPGAASAGQCGAPAVRASSPVDSARSQRFYIHAPEEFAASPEEDVSIFPGEFEHGFLGESKVSEVYCGKTNSSKAVTSWAQKPKKQSHLRGVHAEEGRPTASQGSEQAQPAPAEKFDTGREMKLPSLKDIYHKKQREDKQLPERDLASASCPDRPPEVLTLDPTLHLQPHQQGSGVQPPGFLNAVDDRLSFSPDSVLEPMSGPSDIDSLSQASNVPSQLSGFPKYPSRAKASPVDSWKNHAFPNESRTSSTFPSVYTVTSNDTSVNTVEEENTVMVTAASVSQSQLPGTANSVPECISLASLEDPVMLSNIRQNLKEKHARHIADLRAYYESEVHSLTQRLEAKEMAAVEDWRKTNQILVDRHGTTDAGTDGCFLWAGHQSR
ncbi:M-phase phosphoprotein 9 [Phyllostomus discolor]|uniref:M-phase phosphoprotein 9 n=1 Tax=Phyllostomus discolor TaxID=89673 RepID=A0A834DIE9_9CHIR|nr:M-phase phosphoprotein 9 [Phyllostomus discolor]